MSRPLSPDGQGNLRQRPPIPDAIPRNLPRGIPDRFLPGIPNQIPKNLPKGLPENGQSLPKPPTVAPTAPTNIPSSLGSRFGGAATALSNGAARASGALIVGASLASAAQNPSTRNLVNAGLDVASVVAFSIPNPISQAVGWALQGGKLLFNIFSPPENTSQKIGNDTPPPFTGGQQSVLYTITVVLDRFVANQANVIDFTGRFTRTATRLGPIRNIRAEFIEPIIYGTYETGEGLVDFGSVSGAFGASSINVVSFQVRRTDGQPDTGGDVPSPNPAPIAPAPNNTGQPNFDLQGINDKLDSLSEAVTGLSSGLGTIEAGIQGLRLPQANNGMPMARPNYVPQPLLNPNKKLNPKIEETPQDKPSFKPLFNPFENGAIPSFEASPFISGVSNPDDQFNPRDSKTGLTREQFDQRILEERQKTRDKQEAGRLAAKRNDDKIKKISTFIRLGPSNSPARTPVAGRTPLTLPNPNLLPPLTPKDLIDRFKPPTGCQFSCSSLANCFVDVTVDIFDGCDPKSGQPKKRQITIQVLPKEKARTEAAFKELLKIRSSECSTKTAIATFPDSWAGKIVDDRPQGVVYYREWDGMKFGDYKHHVSIPFYSKPKGFKPSLPMIKKGSFFGILILKDNSQIHVNCESIAEAKRVVNALKQFCGGRARGAKGRYGEVVDGSMKKVTTKAVRLDFYSKGRENSVPDWSVDL